MNIKSVIATAAILSAAAALGCNGGGPTHSQVNSGIDEAFQAPGKVAGAAGQAGGNLAATAVETPGNAIQDGENNFND
ncbi:MAG: hypothetical protein CMJ40_01740 [Phycisphaerae bacterium]|nr:hypothetical protein [Phycisphaerae bacterium]|tara:strand:- start:502 stop:735 length:234 start_codon:yes stop_codon:yes gene_type:complete